MVRLWSDTIIVGIDRYKEVAASMVCIIVGLCLPPVSDSSEFWHYAELLEIKLFLTGHLPHANWIS